MNKRILLDFLRTHKIYASGIYPPKPLDLTISKWMHIISGCTNAHGPWKGHCISIENILSGLLHSNFGQCVRCKDAKKYLFITILKKEAAKIHPGVYKVTIKRWEGEVGVSHFLDCFLPNACDDSRPNRWWLRFMAPSFTDHRCAVKNQIFLTFQLIIKHFNSKDLEAVLKTQEQNFPWNTALGLHM